MVYVIGSFIIGYRVRFWIHIWNLHGGRLMRVLELFAGYGSQALALENLGIDFTSDISEIDKYAIQAYNQLHGETHNWGDITKIDETKLPYTDNETKGQLTLL